MNEGHCPKPSVFPYKGGNTYEITIGENDKLIVTVETKHPRIKPITIMSLRGIEVAHTERGEVYHKVDWSVKPAEKEYYE